MEKEKISIEKTNFREKTVVIRGNLDLITKNGEIIEDTNIKALVQTITFLLERNCKIIIIGSSTNKHIDYSDENSFMSLRFVLGHLINKPIKFANIENSYNSIKFMNFGEILLLENLSFNKEEFTSNKKVSDKFFTTLIDLSDIFVNESFGEDYSSNSLKILTEKLESYFGLNYITEIEFAKKLKERDREGFISIIGGRYGKDRLKLLINLSKVSEKILIGGELAIELSSDNDGLTELRKKIEKNKSEIILPIDFVNTEGKIEENDPNKMNEIGNKTLKLYSSIVENSKVVLLFGNMGKKAGKNTLSLFEKISLLSHKDYYKISGGKDTLEIISSLEIKNKKFNHLTTGFEEFCENIL